MDPYKVLGVPRTATDDEVKKAYKQLAKKYHPDMHTGDPNLKQLEQKFKQVQEAYNLIMQEREGGGTAYGYGSSSPYGNSGSYGGFGGYGSYGGYGGASQHNYSSEPIELQAAVNYINAGRFREALNVLASVKNRTAQWYYLSALSNAGLGNNILAKQQAEQAARMDPGNMDYRFLVEQLSGNNTWYTNQEQSYGRPSVSRAGCCECLALTVLCNLCCCFR